MELVSHHCPIEWLAIWSGEDKAHCVSFVSWTRCFDVLPGSMIAKRANDGGRYGKRSPATACLRLRQYECSVNSLKLLGDTQITHFEVDAFPPETQRFALAKSHR